MMMLMLMMITLNMICVDNCFDSSDSTMILMMICFLRVNYTLMLPG